MEVLLAFMSTYKVIIPLGAAVIYTAEIPAISVSSIS
jgi:hypothetical protein